MHAAVKRSDAVIQNLTLTAHFVERWQEQVGNWPRVEAVRAFLAQSVKVQGCEDLVTLDGQPIRIPAIYWHPELDLVIKVDTKTGAAVTVMSRDGYKKTTLLAARIARIKERFGLNRKERFA